MAKKRVTKNVRLAKNLLGDTKLSPRELQKFLTFLKSRQGEKLVPIRTKNHRLKHPKTKEYLPQKKLPRDASVLNLSLPEWNNLKLNDPYVFESRVRVDFLIKEGSRTYTTFNGFLRKEGIQSVSKAADSICQALNFHINNNSTQVGGLLGGVGWRGQTTAWGKVYILHELFNTFCRLTASGGKHASTIKRLMDMVVKDSEKRHGVKIFGEFSVSYRRKELTAKNNLRMFTIPGLPDRDFVIGRRITWKPVLERKGTISKRTGKRKLVRKVKGKSSGRFFANPLDLPKTQQSRFKIEKGKVVGKKPTKRKTTKKKGKK